MEKFKNLNIFIVDEDNKSRDRYRNILAGLGFSNITEINSEQECLHLLASKPDVIMLDQGKNPTEGIEMIKSIKAINPDIYVVFITDKEHLNVPVNAQKFGAFDYFYKGYREEPMIQIVMQKILDVMDLIMKKPPISRFSFFQL